MFEDIAAIIAEDIWLKIALLILIAVGSNYLFARLGQSKLIGQIVIGIVIGPSVLGLFTIDSAPNTTDLVHWFALIGAIVLLFTIGLECKMKEIYTRNSIIVATCGVIIPWIAGYFLADFMLPDPGVGFHKFAQSVIIGASLVATSVAITAGVMKELGVIGSKPAKLILGAAVVDDVLGMIVLAISSGIIGDTGIQLENILIIATAAVLFVALGAFIGSRYITKLVVLVERKGKEHRLPESGFLLVLAFAFVYAFISEMIGISAIVGAFVAGTSFAACEFSGVYKQRTETLEWLFAPIFFLSLGILVSIMLPASVWIFAIILTVVAILTKLIGCGVPAKLLGMSSRDSMTVGFGMAPRMEVAMIIGLYAFSNGIITGDVYSVIILMGLLTALFTPSILKRTMRDLPKNGDGCEPSGAKN